MPVSKRNRQRMHQLPFSLLTMPILLRRAPRSPRRLSYLRFTEAKPLGKTAPETFLNVILQAAHWASRSMTKQLRGSSDGWDIMVLLVGKYLGMALCRRQDDDCNLPTCPQLTNANHSCSIQLRTRRTSTFFRPGSLFAALILQFSSGRER